MGYSSYPLSCKEETSMIRKLSHHVGIVGVGKIKASVAVRQVLQRQFVFRLPRIDQFCVFTSKCGFLSVITGVFSPETTPTEVTMSGFS